MTASAVRLYCHNVYQLPCIWLEGFLQEVARRLYHLHISIEQDPDVAQEHAKVRKESRSCMAWVGGPALLTYRSGWSHQAQD